MNKTELKANAIKYLLNAKSKHVYWSIIYLKSSIYFVSYE